MIVSQILEYFQLLDAEVSGDMASVPSKFKQGTRKRICGLQSGTPPRSCSLQADISLSRTLPSSCSVGGKPDWELPLSGLSPRYSSSIVCARRLLPGCTCLVLLLSLALL
jgi:hypothetical protein